MRIVIADHSSLPGGGQLGMLRYLRQPSSFERVLVVGEDGYFAEHARDLGIEVHVVPIPGNRYGVISAGPRFRRRIEALSPTAVVANSLRMGNILGLHPTAKYLDFCYLREDLSRESIGGFKRPLMIHGTLKRFDGFIANSRWTASTIPAPLSSLPVKVAYPVSGLTNGSSLNRAAPDPTSKLRLLSLSRLAPWKGIHVLLDALQLLEDRGLGSDISVSICGDALFADEGYKRTLLARAREINVDIEFLGHRDDVGELLSNHDALVHCSTRAEPYGQVIPQSMHHGLLTIATNAGGPAEMIQPHETGILTTPGDAADLADCVAWAVRERDKAHQIGLRAQNWARAFDDETTSRQLDHAIKALTEANNYQPERFNDAEA